MNQRIVSAIFDSRAEAEMAVTELRSAGVSNDAISIVAQRDGDGRLDDTGGNVVGDGAASGATKGLAVGAGVGALFGIAALAIPGVGPFIAAGALANALGATGGALAAGAIVGGTAGGISGALSNYGVSDEDSRYYEERLNDGGVFVSVETEHSALTPDLISETLSRFGGHSATRARSAAL